MEPLIIYRKRPNRYDLPPLNATAEEWYTWDFIFETCKEFKEIIVHCYSDHALVHVQRRNRKPEKPAFVPYSYIWLRRRGDSDFLIINHTAGLLYIPVSPRDFISGDIDDLAKIITDGRTAEETSGIQTSYITSCYLI